MEISERLAPGTTQNVGGLDRKLRGVGAFAFVVVGLALFATGYGTYGAVAALTGAGLLFNAVTGFCVMNAVLGIDTCSRENC